jgi:drug/metabolite transporter (DMT)-like permease
MRAREYSVLFALGLIWGASFLFIKISVEDMPPAAVVLLRLLFSVVTLALVVAIRPSLVAGWRQFWRLGIMVGLINNVIPYLLITWGETRIASGVASILNAATPLFTVLLAHWWNSSANEPLTARRVSGVLVGFLGVGVLVGPSAFQFGGSDASTAIGELAVLVAAAAYGVGALMSRSYKGSASLVAPMTTQVASLVIMLPITLLWGLPTHMPSAGALLSVAELGILGTALAYLLYFWLIQHVGATRTSLVTYLLPCTALLWGALFQSEQISWNALAGLVLVLVGTTLTNGTLSFLRGHPARRDGAAPVVTSSSPVTSGTAGE